jgi:hypothetical protein
MIEGGGMYVIDANVWLFGIGGVVVLAALWLGRGVIFKGHGVELSTKVKAGDVNVGNDADVQGSVGNMTGMRGGMPSEGQAVRVGNGITVGPGGRVGDMTGVDAGQAAASGKDQ